MNTPNDRYHARERGPFYFEIRDADAGTCVGVRVGANARESAAAECRRLNAGGTPGV